MSIPEHLFTTRDFESGDIAFIKATFLKGLYYGDSWFSLIPKDIFMKNYSAIADRLLASPTTAVVIACLKEDPSVILGYSILSSDFTTIHWVFVKSPWRKAGIARKMLPQYPVYASHLSALGKQLMSKFENVKFNPFSIGL